MQSAIMVKGKVASFSTSYQGPSSFWRSLGVRVAIFWYYLVSGHFPPMMNLASAAVASRRAMTNWLVMWFG